MFSPPPPSSEEFFAWRRREFPIFERKIFLTHASVSPLPAASARAVADYAHQLAREGQFDYLHAPIYTRAKERFARLLGNGARPEEIAFAGSTSHALGLVATSLPWKRGENCLVCDGDFPANIVIWKNLAHTHGVEIRVAPFHPHRPVSVEDLAPLIDEKTRLVTVSAVHFLTGFAPNLREIGEFLRARGVLLCVDAIQSLGAVRADFSRADFVCADTHKWLLGPNGTAFAWFRGEVLEQMRPQILGWLAIEGRDDWFSYGTTPFANAERFEPGARNYLGIVAAEKSLEILENAGLENVENRVMQLRELGAQKLENRGHEILFRGDATTKSGNLTFRPRDGDAKGLYAKLDEKFAVSIRDWRDGKQWLRISPHFMNHESDLDALCAAIEKSHR